MYQVVVSPTLADLYLTEGLDTVTGFVVPAEAVASVTDVTDLIDLFQVGVRGAPFAPDRPIDVLKVPASPFFQVMPAVGPRHPSAVFAGVAEAPPFNGTGIAEAAGVRTELGWLAPNRLTAGTQLWRFFPGNPVPELRGVYHGVAWGWQNVSADTYVAAPPSYAMGPIIMRDFGPVPVEVEIGAGGVPEAVTLVTGAQPPEEGFELLPSGVWAKRIEFHSGLDIFEIHANGRVRGVPVRITRIVQSPEGELLGECVSLLPDVSYATDRGFNRVQPGTFLATVPHDMIQDETNREIRPVTWDPASFPFVTASNMAPRNDSQRAEDAFMLAASIAPSGWERFMAVFQIVGASTHFAAGAWIGEERIPISSLPVALIEYANAVKEHSANESGAALTVTFAFECNGTAHITTDHESEPPFASMITAADWRVERERFPRPVPQWAKTGI